jgi:hypothetical protein
MNIRPIKNTSRIPNALGNGSTIAGRRSVGHPRSKADSLPYLRRNRGMHPAIVVLLEACSREPTAGFRVLVPNACQDCYCLSMRPFMAVFLLLVQLSPSVAIGLCVAGVPRGPAELDCPLSRPKTALQAVMAAHTVSASPTAMGPTMDVSTVTTQRGPHCCGVDDLCTLSIPAVVSPRSALVVVGVPHRVMTSGPSSPFASERLTPPSPPPNS